MRATLPMPATNDGKDTHWLEWQPLSRENARGAFSAGRASQKPVGPKARHRKSCLDGTKSHSVTQEYFSLTVAPEYRFSYFVIFFKSFFDWIFFRVWSFSPIFSSSFSFFFAFYLFLFQLFSVFISCLHSLSFFFFFCSFFPVALLYYCYFLFTP